MELAARERPPTTIAPEEASLVARAKADPGAFDRIYRAHYRAVAACIFRRTGDVHTTEDLAAETFIAAYRGLRRYRHGDVPLRHWLLRIATNTVNRWLRRQSRRTWRLRLLGSEKSAPATPEPCGGDAERIAMHVRTLPAPQQAVVSLHYFEGLSVEEIGAAMGCSTGTVKSRLARARASLKDIIEGERP